MSYSVCLSCKAMVPSHEKYCCDCEKTYFNDKDFWKNAVWSALTDERIKSHLHDDKLIKEHANQMGWKNENTKRV